MDHKFVNFWENLSLFSVNLPVSLVYPGSYIIEGSILQDDFLVFVENIQGRDGPHAVGEVISDDIVIVISAEPLARILWNVLTPFVYLLIDIDVHYLQLAGIDQFRNL